MTDPGATRTLSVAAMREADRRAIEDIGIPSVVLMNNAGAAVFREIDGGPVAILCGKGNNGGDGFVVARLCLLAGFDTRTVLIGSADSITGDSKLFKGAYERLGGHVESVQNEEGLEAALHSLSGCSVLVDALLGTGVSGEVRGLYRRAIEAAPAISTLAVDLPSGLNADTGEVCGCCMKASKTVTFQFAKRGFENPQAAPYLGQLIVADIGIPEICGDDEAWRNRTRS